MIAALWLACGAPEPELVAARSALDAFTRGRDALDAGRPADADLAFADALARRPGDPLLGAWRAKALADAGRLDDAVVLSAEVLVARPDFAVARYNRAAWLLRLDRVEEAAPDLARAIADGAATPSQAARDPDVRPHLGHPALGFLPDSPLRVEVAPLPERAFRGSEVRTTLTVTGSTTASWVVGAAVEGPLRWVSAVEDHRPSAADVTAGDAAAERVAELQLTFVVEGPGAGRIGPFDVRSGDDRTVAPAVATEGVGEAGPSPTEGRGTESVVAPSAVAGAWPLETPTRHDGWVWVRAEPTSQVTVVPAAPPARKLELRDEGRPVWVAWGWRAPVERVLVRGVGGVRFDGPVPEG